MIHQAERTRARCLLDVGDVTAAGKPAGFALGNAVGDGNGFANWLLWSHNAALLDEEGIPRHSARPGTRAQAAAAESTAAG